MDLFADQRRQSRDRFRPLAARMRPKTLDDFAGQQHFLGEGKLLRRLLDADRLASAIFYGPPGTGKTTLAEIIANVTQAAFESANAASIGVKDIREILARAKARLEDDGRRTVLFLDEIHRFNKAQQDVLLGDVEDGIVILIGATTENPFFAVNSALVSRSQIFQFESLSEDDIKRLIRRALADNQDGLGKMNAEITDEALTFLAKISDGDARRALTALEVAVLSQGPDSRRESSTNEQSQDRKITKSPNASATPPKASHRVIVDLETAQDSIQRKAINYDPTGDQHYDAASALIKSMRGSDPDAAIYWLAMMLEAGEDPRFIARRIAICAAEDVGNADPMALVVANAAVQTTLFVGLPECQLPLAQAAIYIACAPKSNACTMAIGAAVKDVKEGRTIPVPRHLRDGHYPGAEKLGNASGYQYAHNAKDGIAAQDYLGVDRVYYEPTDRGHEKIMAEYLANAGRIQGKTDET
ncbi:MAG: replication-associated recombination protein A [Phycisphaerales bacterium]|nr:replication-associated recombination protein A [Phycisphaerales bacterium]MCB9855186.1 replication-associated recombination protein A [Phycisphaerales bacterium]MCB9862779.1 replication-associated recombination protein A [Phycisphaerales bacterium]